MELHGLSSFDAAVYCASITAAERMKTESQQQGGGGEGGGEEAGEVADGADGSRDAAAPPALEPPPLQQQHETPHEVRSAGSLPVKEIDRFASVL